MCQINSRMWSLYCLWDSDSGVRKFGTPNSDADPKNPDFVSSCGTKSDSGLQNLLCDVLIVYKGDLREILNFF